VSPAAAGRPARSRVARVVAGVAAILALTALVALAGQATEQGRQALLAKAHDGVLSALAIDFLKHGAQMSVADIKKQLDAFTKNPNAAELKFPAEGRTMMLAAGPRKATQQLEGGRPRGACLRRPRPHPPPHPPPPRAPVARAPLVRCVREVTSCVVPRCRAQASRCSARRRTSSSKSLTSSSRSSAARSCRPTSPWAGLQRSGRRPCR
jgi:hypothetical protein